MKSTYKVLVTNAGRGPAINYCRSLRISEHSYHLIGIEQSKYSIHNHHADECHLAPPAESDEYWPFLQDLVRRTSPDLVYASKTNSELLMISERREELGATTFLPAHRQIELYEDKWATFQRLQSAGIAVPMTTLINTADDVHRAIATYGNSWFRAIRGCGGAGSLPTNDARLACSWIDRFNGWGNFTASEVLSRDTATWLGIWRHGELVVSQIRRRLYWEFAYLAPSGVTGITGAQVTSSDPELERVSLAAIRALDDAPHGIVSVDLTMDHAGRPRVTEIQASRFYTSIYFLARAGLNVADIYTQIGLGGTPHIPAVRSNPLSEGLMWIKYVDCEPVLLSPGQFDAVTSQGVLGKNSWRQASNGN